MPITVLLVEGDAGQSDGLRSLFALSSPDTAVIVAPTLKEALAHDQAAVDVVLADLALPDSSGLETVVAVVRRFAPVPVIVFGSAADTRTAERSIALGAEDYIEKANLSPAAIRRVVRHAIRHFERNAILDAVPDRIFRFDHNLRVGYMNLAATRGLPFIELGMHVDEFFVPPVHRDRWRSGVKRALVSGVAERFDMDGVSAHRYDVSLLPLTHSGTPSVIVVLRDITERVRAQARYETLFASNVAGVFFCGPDGVLTEANRCFLEMVGRTAADVTARQITLQTLMTPAAQAIHGARLREIRERGVLPPLPGELVHANGTIVPVLLASAIVERASDEIVTLVVDDTATPSAENELRNQTLLLDSARDAILLRDQDGRIRFWNEGARRLYGWTREEAMGRSMAELIGTSDDDRGRAADASVLECGEWQGELRQQTKAGAQIVVDSRCSLIPSAYGEPPMMLIINTDITERKWLEQQLLHAQRLESLGTFARGIAHDLNNVLMSILTGSEVLKRTAVPPNAEKAVEQIAASARRGADVIRQLLTFARGYETSPPVVSGKGQLILVIDEERAVLDVTAAMLESFGYRVLTASDGSEGVALYEQNPGVAVVVTDMRMPVPDGPTTIHALRRLDPNVRVLGTSGDAGEQMSGPTPDLVLQKPFGPSDLLNAIHALLG